MNDNKLTQYSGYTVNMENYLQKQESIIKTKIESLYDHHNSDYILNCILEKEEEKDCNELKQLVDIVKDWNILKDGDIIGFIYQTLESLANKKIKGQYFTPPTIAMDIVSKTLNDEKDIKRIKILDPACGSGQFLIVAYQLLLEKYVKSGIEEKKAKKLILKNNLFGFDIDKTAVEITIYNFQKITKCKEITPNIIINNFLDKENLASEGNSLAIANYDIIIGNPPWGSKMNNDEKKQARKLYYSAISGINTFTLFIEKSLEHLNESGRLGFLIPDAYLNIKAHCNSRKHILQNSKIEEISLWGDQFKNVYAPSISIIVEKTFSQKERHSNVIKIYNDKNNQTCTLIPQYHYSSTYQNIFNINYSQRAVSIINKIEEQDCTYLEGNAKFFLGIVTGNNLKYISKEKSEQSPDPILLGKDVTPYQVEFSNNYFKYDSNILQQTAPKHLYETRDKFVYKFIGKKLTFAIDEKGYYMLNNINGFIPDKIDINQKALLGILNSKVMQYYYQKNFFTLKVLKNNLEKLPIKKISKSSEKKIITNVNYAINADTLNEQKKATDKIDDILLYEYDLNNNQSYQVWDHFETDSAQGILPEI